ncbi:hypothetical protein BCAR13_360029 [Paraburkholderia caribensis]|nr:hypothetical protein BCAR13_360029 [Paraburkholderia caribensis]
MEGPSWVARLAGFEPTTPWFVAKYSIQLSYSRTLNLNCLGDADYFAYTSVKRKGLPGGRPS